MASLPSFREQQLAWSHPPVDDVGYISSTQLLAMGEGRFLALMQKATENRYSGWRNPGGSWERILKLDSQGERILDYGCGIGIESQRLAAANRVWIADIAQENLLVATRYLRLSGRKLAGKPLKITNRKPFCFPPEELDAIHCAGVLHHIPRAVEVVEQMARWLRSGGELRLMLYSDRAWKLATGNEPPSGSPESSPDFQAFVQHWDGVGGYADWYDAEKLETKFGSWFNLAAYEAITENGCYVGAILSKR